MDRDEIEKILKAYESCFERLKDDGVFDAIMEKASLLELQVGVKYEEGKFCLTATGGPPDMIYSISLSDHATPVYARDLFAYVVSELVGDIRAQRFLTKYRDEKGEPPLA